MRNEKKKYDSTVARIAGNIIGHLLQRERNPETNQEWTYTAEPRQIVDAVCIARAIVAEVQRTEPSTS